MAPESIYNLLQSIRELLQRASAEGLMPFMLASTSGTPSRLHKTRVFEWATMVIPLLITTIYFGGIYVERLEQISKTQIMTQQIIMKMQNKQHELEVLIKIHTSSDYHGDY